MWSRSSSESSRRFESPGERDPVDLEGSGDLAGHEIERRLLDRPGVVGIEEPDGAVLADAMRAAVCLAGDAGVVVGAGPRTRRRCGGERSDVWFPWRRGCDR